MVAYYWHFLFVLWVGLYATLAVVSYPNDYELRKLLPTSIPSAQIASTARVHPDAIIGPAW